MANPLTHFISLAMVLRPKYSHVSRMCITCEQTPIQNFFDIEPVYNL